MIPAPGTTFAGYRVLSECGKGAYGTVFLTQDALGLIQRRRVKEPEPCIYGLPDRPVQGDLIGPKAHCRNL